MQMHRPLQIQAKTSDRICNLNSDWVFDMLVSVTVPAREVHYEQYIIVWAGLVLPIRLAAAIPTGSRGNSSQACFNVRIQAQPCHRDPITAQNTNLQLCRIKSSTDKATNAAGMVAL